MMHGDTEGTSSGIKIFGNIFISFIGAGILGLPYAFMEVMICLFYLFILFIYFIYLFY